MGTGLNSDLRTYWEKLPIGQNTNYTRTCGCIGLKDPTDTERSNIAGFLSKLVRGGHAEKGGRRPDTWYKKIKAWEGVLAKALPKKPEEITSGEIGESILRIIDRQNEVIKKMKEEKKELAGEIRSLVEQARKYQERILQLQENQAKGGRKSVSLHDLQEQVRGAEL